MKKILILTSLLLSFSILAKDITLKIKSKMQQGSFSRVLDTEVRTTIGKLTTLTFDDNPMLKLQIITREEKNTDGKEIVMVYGRVVESKRGLDTLLSSATIITPVGVESKIVKRTEAGEVIEMAVLPKY